MREIKLRAWAGGKMYRVTELNFANNPDHIAAYEYNDTLESYFEATGEQGSFRGYLKDCNLMQFTGVLDKNGKEIYEGDIKKAYLVDGDEDVFNKELKANQKEITSNIKDAVNAIKKSKGQFVVVAVSDETDEGVDIKTIVSVAGSLTTAVKLSSQAYDAADKLSKTIREQLDANPDVKDHLLDHILGLHGDE